MVVLFSGMNDNILVNYSQSMADIHSVLESLSDNLWCQIMKINTESSELLNHEHHAASSTQCLC